MPTLLRTLLDSLECIRTSFLVILSIITQTSHIPSSRAPVGAKKETSLYLNEIQGFTGMYEPVLFCFSIG